MKPKELTKRMLAWALVAAMTVTMLLGDALPSYAAMVDANGYDVITEADADEPAYEADASALGGAAFTSDEGETPDVYDDVEDVYDASGDAAYGATDGEDPDGAGFVYGEDPADEDAYAAPDASYGTADLEDEDEADDADVSDADDLIEATEEDEADETAGADEMSGACENNNSGYYRIYVHNTYTNLTGEDDALQLYYIGDPGKVDGVGSDQVYLTHQQEMGEDGYDFFSLDSAEISSAGKYFYFRIVPSDEYEYLVPQIDSVDVKFTNIGEEAGDHDFNVHYDSENGIYTVTVEGDSVPSGGGDIDITIATTLYARMKAEVLPGLRDSGVTMTYAYQDGDNEPVEVTLSKALDYYEHPDDGEGEEPFLMLVESTVESAEEYPGYQLIPYGATVTIEQDAITCNDYSLRPGYPFMNYNEKPADHAQYNNRNFDNLFCTPFFDENDNDPFTFTADESWFASDGMITLEPLLWERPGLLCYDFYPYDDRNEEKAAAGDYSFGIQLDIRDMIGNGSRVLPNQFPGPNEYTDETANWIQDGTDAIYVTVDKWTNNEGYTLDGIRYDLYLYENEGWTPEEEGMLGWDDDHDRFVIPEEVVHHALRDPGMKYLIEIKPVAHHTNKVTILVPKDMELKVREGSRILRPDEASDEEYNIKYVFSVPDKTQLGIIPVNNKYEKVSAVFRYFPVEEGDNQTAAISAKNGEYPLAVTNRDVNVDVLPIPIYSLVVKSGGEEVEPVKGKYQINARDGFEVYTIIGNPEGTGSIYSEGVTLTVNGTKTDLTEGKLFYKPEYSGKTLKLLFTRKVYAHSNLISETVNGTLVVSTALEKFTVAGETADHELSVPFGTSKSFKVTPTPSKAVISDLAPYMVNVVGDNVTKGEPIDFGTFDGTYLKVDKDKAYSDIDPGESKTFAFYAGDTRVGEVYTITFSNPLSDQVKPTVTAYANVSTVHDIGIKLQAPSGIDTSAKFLYYEITATASEADQAEDTEFDREGYTRTDEAYKNNLNDWVDWEEPAHLTQIYEPSVTAHIPASQKSASLDVSVGGINPDWGWDVTYDVKARLVHGWVDDDGNWHSIDGDYSAYSEETASKTRGQRFESNLKLNNKAPKKVYIGQQEVVLATPKWSNSTTVRNLDHVTLIDSEGTDRGTFYYYDEKKEENFRWIRFDEDTGLVTVNTVYYGHDENPDYDPLNPDDPENPEFFDYVDYLQPGTYTMTAYAMSGPGKPASASVKFKVVTPISRLELKSSSPVINKTYKKAATVNMSVKYYGVEDRGWKPATKKVTYVPAESVVWIPGGGIESYEPLTKTHPLYGKIKINQKKGIVTIDKSALLPEGYADFYIVAKAADYAGNETADAVYEAVRSTAQIPTSFELLHEDWQGGVYQGDFDSGIRDGAENVSTSNVNYTKLQVFDQFGNPMDPSTYTVKLTGLVWDGNTENPMLRVSKVGLNKITATAKDGSKASETWSFTTVYAENDFSLCVDVHNASRDFRDWHDDETFIAKDGATEGINPYPAASPIYVNVRGTKHFVDGGNEWDEDNMINHSIKVEGGTKKPVAIYGDGAYDNSVTYKIYPTAATTVITVTNKTADAKDEDKERKITITNTAVSTGKAPKYSPYSKKQKIYSRLDHDTDDNYYSNPNVAMYTAASVPQGADTVLISYTGINDNNRAFYRNMLHTSWEDTDADAALGFSVPLNDYRVGKGRKKGFSLEFGEKEDQGEGRFKYRMDEMKPGTYKFAVTMGKMEGGKFTALAKTATLTLKVTKTPKPKVSLKNSKVSLPEWDKLVLNKWFYLPIPAVSNGIGFDSYMELRGNNSKGISNQFANMFTLRRWTHEEAEGNWGIEDQTVCINGNLYVEPKVNNKVWITIGKEDHEVTWFELKKLKTGTWTGTSDKTGRTFKAKDQKKAYKNFVKKNCTGYLECRPIGLDGSYYPTQYLKITFNLDKYLTTWPAVI